MPVRRDAERVTARGGVDQLPLQHQCAFAGRRVDAIDVGRGTLVVADVAAAVASDSPAAVLRHVEILHRLIGELDEARGRHVERLAIREVAILLGARHLQRLNAIVARVPHVHVGGLVDRLALGRWRRHLFFHAEEDALAVVAPVERRAVADDPALREAGRLLRIEHDGRELDVVLADRRRHVAERHQDVVALAHLVDVDALQHGQRRTVIVPGDAAVDLRVVVERRRPSAARVDHEYAVGVLRGRVHRIGEQVAFLREDDVADAAEQCVAPRVEVDEDDVGAASSAFASAACGGCGGTRALRRRSVGGVTTPPASAPSGGDGGTALQHEMCAGGGEDERLNVLPRLHGTRREISEFNVLWRWRRLARASITLRRRSCSRCEGCGRRLCVRRRCTWRGCVGYGWCLRIGRRSAATSAAAASAPSAARIDRVGQPLRVGRERAARGVRHRHVFVGLQVEQMQHRPRLGRRDVGQLQDVCDPFAVVGDFLAGNAPPFRVVVDRHRSLRGRLCRRVREGRGQREQDGRGIR